jgi:serralysin
MGGAGDDMLLGDLGTDTLAGGSGLDLLTGGGDADVFNFVSGDASFTTSGALADITDVVADFVDGIDRIHMGFGLPSAVLHGAAFATLAQAAASAQQILNGQSGFTDVVALKVGNDSYIFYDPSSAAPLEAFRLAGFVDPAAIAAADFV